MVSIIYLLVFATKSKGKKMLCSVVLAMEESGAWPGKRRCHLKTVVTAVILFFFFLSFTHKKETNEINSFFLLLVKYQIQRNAQTLLYKLSF